MYSAPASEYVVGAKAPRHAKPYKAPCEGSP